MSADLLVGAGQAASTWAAAMSIMWEGDSLTAAPVLAPYLVLDKGAQGVVEGHEFLRLPDQRETLAVLSP